MATEITVNLPDSFDLSSTKGEAYSYKVDPSEWSSEYVAYLCEYALGVKVQRCTAGMKDSTPEERAKAREDTIAKANAGDFTRSTGMSLAERALRDALQAQGAEFKRLPTGEKTEKGKDKTKAEPIAETFERWAAAKAKQAGAKLDKASREKLMEALKATTAYKLAMGEMKDEITL